MEGSESPNGIFDAGHSLSSIEVFQSVPGYPDSELSDSTDDRFEATFIGKATMNEIDDIERLSLAQALTDLTYSVPSSKVWPAMPNCSKKVEKNITPKATKRTSTHDNHKKEKVESPVKPSHLYFDEYGNLTVGYTSPLQNEEQKNVRVRNPVKKTLKKGMAKLTSVENLPPIAIHSKKNSKLGLNDSAKPLIKMPNNRVTPVKEDNNQPKLVHTGRRGRSSDPVQLDPSFQPAFKEECGSIPATSRYGRARRRRTDAGFLFGTINFNELRKITASSSTVASVSPRKICVSDDDVHDFVRELSNEEADVENPRFLDDQIVNFAGYSDTEIQVANELSGLCGQLESSDDCPIVETQKLKIEVPFEGKLTQDEEPSLLHVKQRRSRKGKSLPPWDKKKPSKRTLAKRAVDSSLKSSLEPVQSSKSADVIQRRKRLSLKYRKSIQATEMASTLKVESNDATIDEDGSLIDNITKYGRKVRQTQRLDISQEDQRNRDARDLHRELNTVQLDLLEHKPPIEEFDDAVASADVSAPSELFVVGDMVWASAGGSQLWPAVVTKDRQEGCHTRVSYAMKWHKMRASRAYHMQFFNDNLRTCWVNSKSVVEYRGFDLLVTHLMAIQEEVSNVKGSGPKGLKKVKKYDPFLKTLWCINEGKGTKHNKWMEAINEAEDIVKLERPERLTRLTADIKPLPVLELKTSPRIGIKQKGQKRKFETGAGCTEENGWQPKRKRGRPRLSLQRAESEDDFSGFELESNDRECWRNRTGFNLYVRRELSAVLGANKGGSEEEVLLALTDQWDAMTAKQRGAFLATEGENEAIFHDDFSDVDDQPLAQLQRLLPVEDIPRKTLRNEKICFICERGGNDVFRCRGVCCGYFHLSCVIGGTEGATRGDFKCPECQSGQHSCFICKSAELEGEMSRCSVAGCGKFYHDRCVAIWPQVTKQRQPEKLICPRHVCHMCAANSDDINNASARTAPFTRCLRCPTTYHTSEICVAAGCDELSLHSHVCNKHLDLPKKNKQHINVSWCFCCSKGGSLLLCDCCPAAFHADCLAITPPEGDYVCDDCQNGKFPVCGDVVWVKIGNFRWWPSQVLHAHQIPDNIENLSHMQGMFCVHFFGSNEYNWISRGRTFAYQEGDTGNKVSSQKSLDKKFLLALEQAEAAFQKEKENRCKLYAKHAERGNLKPPSYVRIETNRPVGNVRLNKLDLATANRCDCDPTKDEAPCGSDDKCINRMLLFECCREVCCAGDLCNNQRFQKRQYPSQMAFKTERRGWGLKTNVHVKKGEFVNEYVGELIDETEFKRRIEVMHQIQEENYYFLTIDKDIMIDAGPKGNLSRFINHSCHPNCETQKWTVGGNTRVGIFAVEDIVPNTELTFNYNLQCVGTDKKPCNCGAAKCSGFIGDKVAKSEPNTVKRDPLSRKKKKHRRRPVKPSEDECFRCGAPGDLILCDFSACPKGYHLDCLGLDKLPKGKWYCPWHHCDDCGQRATSLCDFCPNSFCRAHSDGNLEVLPGVGNSCKEHNNASDIETRSEASESSKDSEDSDTRTVKSQLAPILLP